VSQPVDDPDLRWTAVGKAADWPANGGRLTQIGARRIGVYHHGDAWYALKDTCPHAGVSLHCGPVQDGKVMCVGHGWTFHLATGEVAQGAAGYKVASYPVRVVDGVVEVGV
jgi:nitrite reductase/ring-hydroxylating ferredoxin subunit